MSKQWILSVVILALVVSCGQGYVKRTEQFATQVKGVANPDELQAWATNLIATARSVDGGTSVGVKAADIPKWVRAIYTDDPGEVSVERLRSGVGNPDAFVQILYGGGFGHWGLAVGYPTLVLTNDENYYILPWKPGIYFWNGP